MKTERHVTGFDLPDQVARGILFSSLLPFNARLLPDSLCGLCELCVERFVLIRNQPSLRVCRNPPNRLSGLTRPTKAHPKHNVHPPRQAVLPNSACPSDIVVLETLNKRVCIDTTDSCVIQ